MFWIVDSILMHKRKKDGSASPQGNGYHRSSARYDRLKHDVESCSDSDSSDNVVYTSQPKHRRHGNRPVPTVDLESKLDSTEL